MPVRVKRCPSYSLAMRSARVPASSLTVLAFLVSGCGGGSGLTESESRSEPASESSSGRGDVSSTEPDFVVRVECSGGTFTPELDTRSIPDNSLISVSAELTPTEVQVIWISLADVQAWQAERPANREVLAEVRFSDSSGNDVAFTVSYWGAESNSTRLLVGGSAPDWGAEEVEGTLNVSGGTITATFPQPTAMIEAGDWDPRPAGWVSALLFSDFSTTGHSGFSYCPAEAINSDGYPREGYYSPID